MHDEYDEYCCPIHDTEVLFQEPVSEDRLEFTSITSPRECALCKKSYYLWECVKRQLKSEGSQE